MLCSEAGRQSFIPPDCQDSAVQCGWLTFERGKIGEGRESLMW